MGVNNFHNNNKPVKTLNNEIFLLLKPSENLKLLVNQFHNASPQDVIDPENVFQFKYYGIDELKNVKITNKDKSLPLFNINVCSLNKKFDNLQHLLSSTNKNFDNLQHLLSSTNKNFDVIVITETRIVKNVSVTNNLTINIFSFELTPTERWYPSSYC